MSVEILLTSCTSAWLSECLHFSGAFEGFVRGLALHLRHIMHDTY